MVIHAQVLRGDTFQDRLQERLRRRQWRERLRLEEKLADGFTFDPEKGCWLWNGATHERGYGILTLEFSSSLIHRLMYEWANGPIPPGLMVCHTCDVRRCANPAHLYAGTAKDNTADCIARHPNPPQLRRFRERKVTYRGKRPILG